ncbi:sugar ABC transporter permease [Streptomyces beijiangensis]|uniref:Xylose transport system permease protein XylH n=1 Tax=Streptomyces beijiangensis TaxID=163361 RepID=A0A939F8W1_9ACTN|nr:sugar ABC transporter permease [Streptomyces beijiangensis]MBO0513102.1 sugar ABC transporter permease [Streptomyces beijiangensis]
MKAYAAAARERLTGRELGALPVTAALAVIMIVFSSLNSHFLSSENLTNLALQMAATGTISLGVIMVLLLGEIDLSVGSVSGLCAVVMTIQTVRHGLHPLLAVLLALAAGAAIGLLHGLMFTRIGMPSFVVTLSGLIGWQGLLIYLLGKGGTINLPFDGSIAKLSDTWLPDALSWTLAAVITAVYAAVAVLTRRARAGLDLPFEPVLRPALRITALAALLAIVVRILTTDRGVPLTLVIFASLVVVLDVLIRHTVAGRRMYAVGGNAEAARRSGINVTRVRTLAFVASGTIAAFGGVLAASRLSAVNQNSGGSDILLNAIAAAVIGGVSLFGGRGRTYAALLGILVIQSITNGMLLLNVDSSVRFMVTALVLALAVALDSLARKGRPEGLG